MLTAIDSKGNLVHLLGAMPAGQAFFCPTCQGPVRLRQGRVKRPHFAHISLEDCHHAWENESAEHLDLKGLLYAWASQSTSVRLEANLSELGQVADLLLGEKLALEVQCSPLSVSRLFERTEAYRRQGYQVLWLLGENLWIKSHLSKLQRHFLYFSRNRGFHLWELDWKRQVLRLKYLIHQDLRGRLQYLTQTFPMGEGDLLDCLRQPFAQQAGTRFQGKMEPDVSAYLRQQLYYRVPKWMAYQAECYSRGDNLLTLPEEAFYPQIRPVAAGNFCQIEQDLTSYYQNFDLYYKNQANKRVQFLYPPVFYDKMEKERKILW